MELLNQQFSSWADDIAHLESLFFDAGGLFLLEVHFQLGILLETVRIVKGEKTVLQEVFLFQGIFSDITWCFSGMFVFLV